MSGLPEGWQQVLIGETCSIITGKTPPTKRPELFDGEIPFFKPGDLDKGGVSIEAASSLSPEGAKIARLLPIGSVLVSCIGNLGKTALLGIEGSCNQQINAIIPPKHINPVFVYYWARTIKEWLEANSSATTVSIINKERFSKAVLSLPPTNEQKRIVKKLTTCEARIEAAREALSEVPKLLEDYRQSVLAAAFRGDLTSKWRAQNPEVESAEKLLERLRHERRQRWEQDELERYEAKGKAPPKDWKKKYKAPEPLTKEQIDELPELPEGWCWASPQELVSEEKYALSIGPFGSNLKKSDYQDSGMPLIFVRDIRTEFDEAKVTKYVTHKKGAELLAHQISGGDLVITKMGDPPGDISRYPIESPDAIITADCIKLRIHKEVGEPDFYKWAIRSSTVQKHIKSIAKGVAQQKVSLARFATTPIPVVPIGEQIELLRILETVENSMKFMKAAATDSTQTLDSLTQSLLAKAFRGELVPQGPNDEPASKLLERIAEERQQKAKKVSSK